MREVIALLLLGKEKAARLGQPLVNLLRVIE